MLREESYVESAVECRCVYGGGRRQRREFHGVSSVPFFGQWVPVGCDGLVVWLVWVKK
jgi:hypothetical protein